MAVRRRRLHLAAKLETKMIDNLQDILINTSRHVSCGLAPLYGIIDVSWERALCDVHLQQRPEPGGGQPRG